MIITKSKNILGLKIDAKISDRAYDEIAEAFSAHILAFGKIRVFLVVEHYASLNSAESLYDDLRFLKMYADHIEKTAIVCDKSWKKTWVALFGLFAKIKLACFEPSAFNDAWHWVSNGQQ